MAKTKKKNRRRDSDLTDPATPVIENETHDEPEAPRHLIEILGEHRDVGVQ